MINCSPVTNPSQWVGHLNRSVDAEVFLYCLPYSGAGASVFRHWSKTLPSAVALCAVRLPGREQRIAEPHDIDPEQIASVIAATADRPYALYGHSLGARVGFEVLKALRRHGAPLPIRFYPAAARPPDVIDPLAAEAVDLPDDQFLALLTERLSAPTDLRDEPELRDLMLPVLRADLGWIHRHRYCPEPPLPVPIVALAGEEDREYGPDEMLGWARHTSSTFQVRTISGDHFFVGTAEGLTALLADELVGEIR
jgi:surfactin synthase thioesterase subunit